MDPIDCLPWAFAPVIAGRADWSLSREEIARLSDREYYLLTYGRVRYPMDRLLLPGENPPPPRGMRLLLFAWCLVVALLIANLASGCARRTLYPGGPVLVAPQEFPPTWLGAVPDAIEKVTAVYQEKTGLPVDPAIWSGLTIEIWNMRLPCPRLAHDGSIRWCRGYMQPDGYGGAKIRVMRARCLAGTAIAHELVHYIRYKHGFQDLEHEARDLFYDRGSVEWEANRRIGGC